MRTDAGSAWSGSTRRRPSRPICGPSSSSTTAGCCQFTDPRRFGHASLLPAGELGALSRLADRGRAARRSDDRRADRADRRGPQSSAEVVPARPEGDRGDRQHLRRRGVAPGRAPSAVAGGVDAAGALGGAPRGHRRGARGRPAQRRGIDRRLPGLARRAGVDAGRVPRPHASGRGVPPLRRADQPDRRLRTLHLLLPRLPGQIAPPRGPASARPVRPGPGDEPGRDAAPRRLRGRPLDRGGGADRLHRDPAAPRIARRRGRPRRRPGNPRDGRDRPATPTPRRRPRSS